jgi:RimJ/RimL family protein N-acetyltransferase
VSPRRKGMDPQRPEPILNLRGKKVGLGPLRKDLLPLMTKWMNDFDVTRTLALGMRPMSHEAEEAWYARAANHEHNTTFHIYELESLRPIGNCGLFDVDHRNGKAELGIAIGEKDCWGKGYATEVCRLLLDYAFSGLGLNSVMLNAYADNPGALKAYQHAGFKEFGRRREAFRRGRKRFDLVYFDCLASEFEPGVMKKFE